jgi:hypothetical protein
VGKLSRVGRAHVDHLTHPIAHTRTPPRRVHRGDQQCAQPPADQQHLRPVEALQHHVRIVTGIRPVVTTTTARSLAFSCSAAAQVTVGGRGAAGGWRRHLQRAAQALQPQHAGPACLSSRHVTQAVSVLSCRQSHCRVRRAGWRRHGVTLRRHLVRVCCRERAMTTMC